MVVVVGSAGSVVVGAGVVAGGMVVVGAGVVLGAMVVVGAVVAGRGLVVVTLEVPDGVRRLIDGRTTAGCRQ